MRLYEAGNLAEATLAFEAVVNKQPDNAVRRPFLDVQITNR